MPLRSVTDRLLSACRGYCLSLDNHIWGNLYRVLHAA